MTDPWPVLRVMAILIGGITLAVVLSHVSMTLMAPYLYQRYIENHVKQTIFGVADDMADDLMCSCRDGLKRSAPDE